jgi:hypothetical protein
MNVTIATILALAFLSALFFLALCATASGPTPPPRVNPKSRIRNPKSAGRFHDRRRSFENDNDDEDDVSGRMAAGCCEN